MKHKRREDKTFSPCAPASPHLCSETLWTPVNIHIFPLAVPLSVYLHGWTISLSPVEQTGITDVDRGGIACPAFTTIWPKGQMDYFRTAPSKNQLANCELSSCLLFCCWWCVCKLVYVPKLRQEARQYLIPESEKMEKREGKRDGEMKKVKETWKW